MDVHRPLLPVGDAENVDAVRPDGQDRRQEVPQRLQPALPLEARVDKITSCTAFGRQGEQAAYAVRFADCRGQLTGVIKVEHVAALVFSPRNQISVSVSASVKKVGKKKKKKLRCTQRGNRLLLFLDDVKGWWSVEKLTKHKTNDFQLFCHLFILPVIFSLPK